MTSNVISLPQIEVGVEGHRQFLIGQREKGGYDPKCGHKMRVDFSRGILPQESENGGYSVRRLTVFELLRSKGHRGHISLQIGIHRFDQCRGLIQMKNGWEILWSVE